jgi:uncharacterized damage-inducible protein DinB
MASNIHSQPLPYHEIPSAPETYTAGNVIGRLVDGLGFRYYWATKGLHEKDLNYQPSEQGRTINETLDHIYGLSLTIVNAPQSMVNERPANWSDMTFQEKRKQTLLNFQKASELIKSGAESDMKDYKVIFKRGENQSEFPFWNMINGPISDAIWHTGQVVLLRRAAGNPINPKVSVFAGKLRE